MAKTKLNRAGIKAMLNAPDVAAMLAAEAAQKDIKERIS